jgi:hypothetical protein
MEKIKRTTVRRIRVMQRMRRSVSVEKKSEVSPNIREMIRRRMRGTSVTILRRKKMKLRQQGTSNISKGSFKIVRRDDGGI